MFIAAIVLTVLGVVLGGLLGLAAKIFAVGDENPLVKEVEAQLAGSQCGQCGFPGCGPAAVALVEGTAPINLCPPGGKAVIEALAAILDVDPNSYDAPSAPMIATITDSLCVGCTRCAKTCPTDAIVGANRQLHIVMSNACTGCGNCKEVCPENCIELHPEVPSLINWHWPKPEAALPC